MKHTLHILSVALLLGALAISGEAQVSVRRSAKKSETTTATEKPRKASRKERSESPATPDLTTSPRVASSRPVTSRTDVSPVSPVSQPAAQPVVQREAQATATRKATPSRRPAQQTAAPADGVTLRQQAFDQYQRDEVTDVPWQHVVYRELDLQRGSNASLYYPVEPMDGMQCLFAVIMEAMCKGELSGYEFLDGREVFTDKYKVKTRDLLDKFQVYYQVKEAGKGTPETYEVDESDVPSNEVLSYYIKERWEFDQKHGKFRPRVLALCPVIHRTGDFGGEATRYPMCWFTYEDLRPFMRQHLVMSDGMNNTPRYTMEEFFALEQYQGEIYKVQNLRGLSLMQMYPDSASLADARTRIDAELRQFGKSIWIDEEAEKAKAAAADSTARAERQAARAARGKSGEKRSATSSRRNRRTHEEVDMEAAAEAEEAKLDEMDARVERDGAAHSVRRRR